MNKEYMWRIKYVKILELLRQESDADRPITTNDMLKKLQERDVYVDRKILYEDIKVLNKAGYDIKQIRKKQNEYYLEKREFDVAELRVLMDAISAATFISEKKTPELLEKIAELSGSYRKRLLMRDNNLFETNKHSNEKIYYSINEIEEAITRDRQVSFKYFDIDHKGHKAYRTKDGKERIYTVNPIATLYSNDNYYLVCYSDKYDNYSNYRIDRMERTSMEEKTRTPSKLLSNFNPNKYRKKYFGMFGGETEIVTIEFDKTITEVIYDKFGESTKITEKDGKLATKVEVAISQQFYGWILGLGTKIKLTAPTNIVDAFRKYVDEVRDIYLI